MSLRLFFSFCVAGLLLSACATDRVAGPAKVVAQVVSGMQADLSRFDTEIKTLQSGEASLTAGNNLVRDLAVASTRQTQTAAQVAQSPSTTEAFKLLQDQANAEVAALLAPTAQAASATSATLPIEKLGSVASTLNQLSKPPNAKADLESLINFGTQVNSDLSTAKSAPAGGAGH
jgi:hypothetical protein